MRNYRRGLLVADALGLPSTLPHAAAGLANTFSRNTPEGFKAFFSVSERASALGSRLLGFGRSVLINGMGHGTPHFLGRHRRAEAAKLVAAAKGLPLTFPRHELGMAYTGHGAVIVSELRTPSVATAAVDAELPPLKQPSEGYRASARAESQPREESWKHVATSSAMEDDTYLITSAPGFRLPHHWLVMTHCTDTSEREASGAGCGGGALSAAGTMHGAISTLELVTSPPPELYPLEPSASVSPPQLTLIVDAAGDRCWARGAQHLPVAMPLHVVRVATALSATAEGGCGARGARTLLDMDGGWAAKRQVEPCGALLVRPDGHVAWRAVSKTTERVDSDAQAAARLAVVIEHLLHPGRL